MAASKLLRVPRSILGNTALDFALCIPKQLWLINRAEQLIYTRYSSIKERPNSCDNPGARINVSRWRNPEAIILHSQQPMPNHIFNHGRGQAIDMIAAINHFSLHVALTEAGGAKLRNYFWPMPLASRIR